MFAFAAETVSRGGLRLAHQGRQGRGGNVLDVRLAAVDGVHLAGVQVDAGDLVAGFRKGDGQGQADIAEADDGDMGVVGVELGEQESAS